jgi:hypothetical protein
LRPSLNDPQSTIDTGVHIIRHVFNALAFQTITITDTTNSSIVGDIVGDVLAQSGGRVADRGRLDSMRSVASAIRWLRVAVAL